MTVSRQEVPGLTPVYVDQNLVAASFGMSLQTLRKMSLVGVLLAGKQGIGKDLILFVMKAVVGWSNSRNISPGMAAGDFNPFLRSVLLVIDEARPADSEMKAVEFYNKLKTMTTAPPDVVAVNDKHEKHAYTVNVCRVFITTNDSLSFYLPPDDRRWFVCQSPCSKEETKQQCEHLFKLIDTRPDEVFGALLNHFMEVDVSAFNPTQAAPMTDRKRQIIEHWGGMGGDGPVERTLAFLGDGDELPRVVFVDQIIEKFAEVMQQEDNKKPSRQHVVRDLDKLGYQVEYPKPQRAWFSETGDPVKFNPGSGYRRPDVPADEAMKELAALARAIAENKPYKSKVVSISAAGRGASPAAGGG